MLGELKTGAGRACEMVSNSLINCRLAEARAIPHVMIFPVASPKGPVF